MGEIRLFRADQLSDLVQELNSSFQADLGCILLIDRALQPKQIQVIEQNPGIICLATGHQAWKGIWPSYVMGYVDDPNDREQLLWALESAKRFLDLRHENQQLRFRFNVEGEKLDSLLRSALEFSEERDPLKLCDKVLSNIRRQLRAEGASLYLADPDKSELKFVHVQNEKVKVPFSSFTLPIDESSMAGACAFRKKVVHVPDVRKIPRTETFKFNDSFDKRVCYTTRSTLCIPLIKSKGDLVGVVQLINSKRDTTFTEEDIEIGRVLAAPIAASLETALLYQDIERLFEGFVKASVTAIESRDPATSGHSERVAEYTLNLAQSVTVSKDKEFEAIRFDDHSLKQMRYASLLHDFGKIGVPENILQKEKKLYPDELEAILMRARMVKLGHPDITKEIDFFIEQVLRHNEPTVVHKEAGDILKKFLDLKYSVLGEDFILLTEDEHQKLSLQKGSLTADDRSQIESHVEHTYRFLAQIPWTRELKRVPEVAYGHHEKLDGTGYPRRIKVPEIPFESQIMAIADIYDALTAPDRPYKKSVPVPRALEILKEDASRGKINSSLVELFIAQKAFELKD